MSKSASKKKDAILIISSINDVQSYIEWRTKFLPTKIDFYCTKEVKKALLHGTLDNANAPIRRIDEILVNNGVCKYYINARNTRIPIFNISIYRYYVGFRIIQLIQMTRDDLFTIQERQTLTAAWRIIDGIHGSVYERLLTLSRIIGKNTEYTSYENSFAYGPLLYNKGNCSGIADAFYLCATLAGLKVRYQYGCSNLPEHATMSERHLWNTVYIGRWRMVDVTWNQRIIFPQYININFQEARKYYRWNYDLYDEN